MQISDTVPPFAIFRNKDASAKNGVPIMRSEPMSEAAIAGGMALMEAGVDAGHDTRLLFAAGPFSLTHAWFKSGFPLPRHSHDTDCLYYVVAGSLKLGREELGPGDGFFIGGGTPYTYVPGPQGVEVLEFRAGGNFNIDVLANNPAFWDKALEQVKDRREGWASEGRPSAVLAGT